MANWAEVDWEELNKPRRERINGVEVIVYFSPYDMPEAVQGDYDATKDRFVIQFQYLGGDEPLEFRDRDPHIRVGIGKQTKRLHEILVDVKALQANIVKLEMCHRRSEFGDEVAKEVKKAITDLAHQPFSPSVNTENYMAASEALEQQRDRVYSRLPVTCG